MSEKNLIFSVMVVSALFLMFHVAPFALGRNGGQSRDENQLCPMIKCAKYRSNHTFIGLCDYFEGFLIIREEFTMDIYVVYSV